MIRNPLRLGIAGDRKSQRGAAMIEMALVLPLYFLLCWGFMVFAFILFGYCNATFAARQAARYAAFHGSTSTVPCISTDLSTLASQYLWGAPSNTTISASWPNGNGPGNWVKVYIKMVYPTGIPFSSLTSVTIGTTATEVILQ